jgi:hypothetical protein
MAPPAPRECNQPACSTIDPSFIVLTETKFHCIANNPRTVQRSAAQPSALHRNQLAAHRPAHRIPCNAAHCIASCAAQRTVRMQPARVQRIASESSNYYSCNRRL